jgi:hypothetical protein
MRATSLTHLIHLDLITQLLLREEYNLKYEASHYAISAFCYFSFDFMQVYMPAGLMLSGVFYLCKTFILSALGYFNGHLIEGPAVSLIKSTPRNHKCSQCPTAK